MITSHPVACTLTAREHKGALPEADLSSVVAHALRGEGFDAGEDGTGRGTPIVPVAFPAEMKWAVRRLTPTECERLQGFPDNYTDIGNGRGGPTPDGPRYKALGNSMAVNVMRWIGLRMQDVQDKW
jgi:DNA (cytosine-5)-methyltransferase 1